MPLGYRPRKTADAERGTACPLVEVHGSGGGRHSLRSLQGASNVEIAQRIEGALTLPPGVPSPACAVHPDRRSRHEPPRLA
jgi:hypothetical protein